MSEQTAVEAPTPEAGPPAGAGAIPAMLGQADAGRFWLAILLTGIGTGAAAAALTRLLEMVQRLTWGARAPTC